MTAEAFSSEIPSFVVGELYSRTREITGKYGGSAQSGIAPSARTPAIFIFTGASAKENGYEDLPDVEGCLLYCGEGQIGNQTMERGNRAIANHVIDGRAIHAFNSSGKGKLYQYLGEFTYGSHFIRQLPGRDGVQRDVIVFRLVPVSHISDDGPLLRSILEDESVEYMFQDLVKLRQKALEACNQQPQGLAPGETIRAVYQRAAKVKQYVLARANGSCELCQERAPFYRKSDGMPYLEPHHIDRLSDGGLDHPAHVGAICPTCHRLIHFGVDGDARNDVLRKRILAIEKN